VWYNQALFDEKGWEYPETWDDMLALCQTIKDEGEYAPWTYQGIHPYYIRGVFDQMVYKAGGWDAQLKLDNITEDAWTQPVVKQAMDTLRQLWDNGYIMEGTEGLSHTESQAFWIQGDAVFIPCGAWLENEMKDVLADFPDFKMVVKPAPSLSAEDALPFTATQASAGEDFIVFSKGKNVQGGKEYLRLLFSQEGARFFSEATKSLTAVKGSAEGLELGTAFQSVQDVIDAAGENVFVPRWPAWYPDLDELSRSIFSELMTGKKSSDEVIAELQALTDQIRNDSSIPKFEKVAPGATPAS
jgi:N-acetylglucosamine transport system substrate-binding protein